MPNNLEQPNIEQKKLKQELAKNPENINIFATPTAEIVKKIHQIPDTRGKLKALEQMGIIEPIEIAGPKYHAIDYSGRTIVIAKVGNTRVPFYRSTGLGGKADVEAGKWYSFFGLGDETGWFNKASQPDSKVAQELISVQYNNPELQKIAHILNQGIGKIDIVKDGKIQEGYWKLQDNSESIAAFNKNLQWATGPENNLYGLMSSGHAEEILIKLREEAKKFNGGK